MKHRFAAAGLALAAFWAVQATADDDGLARCARISSPLDRLACYDALTSSSGETPATASAPAAPLPVPAATPEPTPPENAPDSFGFEKQAVKTGDKEIVARYVGEFSGWSGGTLFKLDNGQVWKQAQSGRVFHRRDNPVITIRRGALGSFRLTVEGTKRSVRVKRIK